MRTLILISLIATACSGSEISVTPTEITWGAVDFNLLMPPSGYDAVAVNIHNTGNKPVQVSVLGIDSTHITVFAQVEFEDPPTPPAIEAGLHTIIEIGVTGYEPGELDTEISGSVFIASNSIDEDTEIRWTFTPQREADGD
ncbi:MAG: hypothetical protein ACI9MC_003560 [Kiritimatiellia bacterium]|jgi:hypothetical protein